MLPKDEDAQINGMFQDFKPQSYSQRRAELLAAQSANVGQQVTQGRGDQPLIRRFADYKQATQVLQSLPCIHFLNGEHEIDLWHKGFVESAAEKGNLAAYMREWKELCAEAMQNLFWNDCIFYWVMLESKRRFWARIRTAASYFQDDAVDDAISDMRRKAGAPEWFNKQDQKPEDEKTKKVAQDDVFQVSYFWEDENKEIFIAEGFINRKDPMNQARLKDKFINQDCLNGLIAVCTLYAYLAQTNERTVEIRQAAPKAPAGSKTAKKKPWMRDDLLHIILLDPTKASTVGWQKPENAPEGLHRKSPIPHDRRGHWRFLKAIEGVRESKRVFVRPSWIGPTDWTCKGKIYKVVQERKDGT